MKSIPFTITGILLVITSFSVTAQDKWNLKRCVEYAMANNISVKQANINAQDAALVYHQSLLERYPTANFTNNWGLSFGRNDNPTTGIQESINFLSSTFNLTSQVNIFNFYRQRNVIAANKYSAEANKASEEKAKNDIALRVANAYLLALQAKEQINISSNAVAQTKEQLGVTRKRVDAGALPELNAAEIEAQLARDSSTLITAVSNAELQLLQLKAILNIDAAAPFEIETPPVDQIPVDPISDLQPAYVFELAIKALPQQKVNDFKILSAQKNADAARSAMLPSLGGFLQLSTNFSSSLNERTVGAITGEDQTGLFVRNGTTVLPVISPQFSTTQNGKKFGDVFNNYGTQLNNNFGQNVGVGITVPIFNGGSARIKWERAKLNIKNLQLQKDLDNQTLKQDIYTAYNNAIASFQVYNANKKALETSQRTYDLAKKRFDVSLLNTFELITNQTNLNRAKLDLLVAQYDYVFKMKLLEFYKGEGLKL
jgi:outer membrane protein